VLEELNEKILKENDVNVDLIVNKNKVIEINKSSKRKSGVMWRII
jgi:hypothetical protein